MSYVDSVWHGNYRRPSHRLCDDRDVRIAVGDRSRRLPAHHHPAVCCWTHSPAAGRAAAERLRTWLGHFTVHCNEHLRDNCVEGIQPNNGQHGSWYVDSTGSHHGGHSSLKVLQSSRDFSILQRPGKSLKTDLVLESFGI